jgi:hypothetical protein
MKSKNWTTKDGTELEISEMETNHIKNCIKLIDRIAKNGMEVIINCGYAPDNDYIEYDSYVMTGNKVYDHYKKELKCFKEELEKRKDEQNT